MSYSRTSGRRRWEIGNRDRVYYAGIYTDIIHIILSPIKVKNSYLYNLENGLLTCGGVAKYYYLFHTDSATTMTMTTTTLMMISCQLLIDKNRNRSSRWNVAAYSGRYRCCVAKWPRLLQQLLLLLLLLQIGRTATCGTFGTGISQIWRNVDDLKSSTAFHHLVLSTTDSAQPHWVCSCIISAFYERKEKVSIVWS